MLPERKLVGIRIKATGEQVSQVMEHETTATPVSEPPVAVGLMFWANLFALAVIAALF
jgi:hypothetical protein